MIGYGPEVWRAGNYYFWVPMVAPFCGATFGGFLYDTLLYTGQSPINTPYWGLYRLVPSMRRKYKGITWNLKHADEEDIEQALEPSRKDRED